MPPAQVLTPSKFGSFRPDLAEGMKSYTDQMLDEGMIGMRLAPPVEVGEASGDIGRYPLGDLLRIPETRRASGAPYPTGGIELEEFNYATKDQGYVIPVDERKLKLFRNKFAQLEQYQATMARQFVGARQEERIIQRATDASVMTGALTAAVTTSWVNTATAKPITDITALSFQVFMNCGFVPNTLACSYEQFLNLRENLQIIDRISANGAGDKVKPSDITEAMVAEALGLRQLLVSKRAKNTAAKGDAMSLTLLWPSDEAVLCYVHPGNGNPFEPGFMVTYHWGEDGSVIGGTIETDGDWDTRSTKVRCRMDTDEKQLYPEMGLRITNLD